MCVFKKELSTHHSELCKKLTVQLNLEQTTFDTKMREKDSHMDVLQKHFERAKGEIQEKLRRECDNTKRVRSELKEVQNERKALEHLIQTLQQEKGTLQSAVKQLEGDLSRKIDFVHSVFVSNLSMYPAHRQTSSQT